MSLRPCSSAKCSRPKNKTRCAVWNTVYLQAALEQLRSEGYEIDKDDVKHLSPARSEHINIYGRYYFNIEEGFKRKGLRELRKPEKSCGES